MTPEEYIIEKISQLTETFDNIKCQYGYENFYKMHFVKILPFEVYEHNENFIRILSDILYEFDTTFWSEELFLFSEDASRFCEIKNLIFEKAGENYYSKLNHCEAFLSRINFQQHCLDPNVSVLSGRNFGVSHKEFLEKPYFNDPSFKKDELFNHLSYSEKNVFASETLYLNVAA